MKLLKNIIDKSSVVKKKSNLFDVPSHVAIIMDGNGRWAQKRGLPRIFGHRAGVESLRRIIRTSSELGIKYLTLYAFSTENWKRPAQEVMGLMDLLVEYLQKEIDELYNNNVQIRTIGEIDALPINAKSAIINAVKKTSKNSGLIVSIALNYGSRAEIIKGIHKLVSMVDKGEIALDAINEELVSSTLYTAGIPDPDLIIRTSGECRLSNFLLFQAAYSELWFTEIFWPDFNESIFLEALLDYQRRHRRFGGISTVGRNE